MSFTLENCTDADLRRFTLCWLLSEQSTNWAKAAELYDPKVQVASFKTVTGRAAKKVVKGTDLEDFQPNKASGVGKRKKVGGEDDDTESPAPKQQKKGKGGKKPKSVTPTEEEDDAEIPV